MRCRKIARIATLHYHSQFDFVVATNGIYKFRLLQEQQDGRALLQWYWINPTTGARDLVRPLFLESAAAVNGPYTAETTAAINPSDKTVTIARSGNARFYRLRSTTAYKISSIASKGNSILMNYQ